jgi:hypothetical protein
VTDEDNNLIPTAKINKNQVVPQADDDENFENFPTSIEKEDQINKALVKLFVCCNYHLLLLNILFFMNLLKFYVLPIATKKPIKDVVGHALKRLPESMSKL